MTGKFFLSIAASMLVTAAAAADLPSVKGPAAPPPPPVFSWTGPYAGLTIGYGWADTSAVNGFGLSPALAFTGVGWTTNSPNASGVIGGAQVGYNYQFANTGFVVGVETDFLGADIKAATTAIGSPVTGTGVFPFARTFQSVDWFGTVRGRVGYAILPTLLLYGAGGFAYGHVSTDFLIGYTNGFFDGASQSDVRTGWTAGGGVEWAFRPNLSLKVEYLYVDLGGSATIWDGRGCHKCPPPPPGPVVPPAFISTQTGAPNRFSTIKAGLNYRFNFLGAPGAPFLGSF